MEFTHPSTLENTEFHTIPGFLIFNTKYTVYQDWNSFLHRDISCIGLLQYASSTWNDEHYIITITLLNMVILNLKAIPHFVYIIVKGHIYMIKHLRAWLYGASWSYNDFIDNSVVVWILKSVSSFFVRNAFFSELVH